MSCRGVVLNSKAHVKVSVCSLVKWSPSLCDYHYISNVRWCTDSLSHSVGRIISDKNVGFFSDVNDAAPTMDPCHDNPIAGERESGIPSLLVCPRANISIL